MWFGCYPSPRWLSPTVIVAAVLGLGFACSGSGDGGAPAVTNTTEQGVCADTCPQPCVADGDCNTSDGELCCDYGENGNACAPASACPRYCEDDTRCDLQSGEACVRTTLASSALTCERPSNALHLCDEDSECETGMKCCTIYDDPICLPFDRCPSSCEVSDDCNTGSNEICCKTLDVFDKTLRVPGLCIDPRLVHCPTTCDSSSDCDTGDGEICCDGVCSTSCGKQCSSSNDCAGQICCKTRAKRSPFVSGSRAPGYAVVLTSASGSSGAGGTGGTGGANDDPTTSDLCAEDGFYGDGICDTFCLEPDPDCSGVGAGGAPAVSDPCEEYYGDGFCDTVCWYPDPDCTDLGAGGAVFVVGGAGPVAEAWRCSYELFGTDDGCDCGCGEVDPDCGGVTSDYCEYCAGDGSCATSCNDLDPEDNASCI